MYFQFEIVFSNQSQPHPHLRPLLLYSLCFCFLQSCYIFQMIFKWIIIFAVYDIYTHLYLVTVCYGGFFKMLIFYLVCSSHCYLSVWLKILTVMIIRLLMHPTDWDIVCFLEFVNAGISRSLLIIKDCDSQNVIILYT